MSECPARNLASASGTPAERTTHGGIWVEYDNYFWEVADIKNNKVMLIELNTGEMERIIPADVFLRECFSIDYE